MKINTLCVFLAGAFALLVCISSSKAATVLGTGAGALIGRDLCDREDDSVGSGTTQTGFEAVISGGDEPTFAGEASWDIFGNDVGSGGSKWCCGGIGTVVNADLTAGAYPVNSQFALSHFTVASGNDSPGRRPRDFDILDAGGTSIANIVGNATNTGIWTANNQVIRFDAGTDYTFTPSELTTAFGYRTNSTGSGHQINEVEYFGPGLNTSLVDGATIDLGSTGSAVDALFMENVGNVPLTLTGVSFSNDTSGGAFSISDGFLSGVLNPNGVADFSALTAANNDQNYDFAFDASGLDLEPFTTTSFSTDVTFDFAFDSPTASGIQFGSFTATLQATAFVPEPSTFALSAFAITALGAFAIRRRRQA